jgi:hypothetical protein
MAFDSFFRHVACATAQAAIVPGRKVRSVAFWLVLFIFASNTSLFYHPDAICIVSQSDSSIHLFYFRSLHGFLELSPSPGSLARRMDNCDPPPYSPRQLLHQSPPFVSSPDLQRLAAARPLHPTGASDGKSFGLPRVPAAVF